MSDTKLRFRKATTLLREDHRTVKKLFKEMDQLEDGDTEGLVEIYERVKQELEIHAQIEEEIFYPAVRNAQDEEAETLVEEANEEHRIVKQLLGEIGELSAADDEEKFCAKMKVLKDNVLHHAEEEEKEIFPVFEDLDKEVQDEVAERLYSRKRELSPEE